PRGGTRSGACSHAGSRRPRAPGESGRAHRGARERGLRRRFPYVITPRAVMSMDGAIGIFDSGVGGLTVLHALLEGLPPDDLVYRGDTGRYPYGTKSAETVTRFSIENVEFLAEKGLKLLVVACNSASAVALDALSERWAFPVLGVIEPGARAAVARTRNGRVGVIGTDATIASGAYTRALRALRPTLEIYTRPCPLLVPLAEEGWLDGPRPRGAAGTDPRTPR